MPRSQADVDRLPHPQARQAGIRPGRDEWTAAGIFARLKQIALEAYDLIVGLVLDEIAAGGCITRTLGGGQHRRSLVDAGQQGIKRSLMVSS